MTESNTCVVAADLGGTRIRVAVLAGDGECLYRAERPSRGSEGRQAVLRALQNALCDCFLWAEQNGIAPAGIGVSCAGTINGKTGTVLDATDAIPDWKGTELARELSEQFNLPVAIENDVKAALLGELAMAPQAPAETVAMITLGTGLGGAIAHNGQTAAGAHFVAGHFGRMRVPSPWCAGGMVSQDALVSGTGLKNIANHLAGEERFDDGKSVLTGLIEGDPVARAALTDFCEHLVMVLENIYWALDPDRIIIGGGMIDAREHWWDKMQDLLKQKSLPLKILAAQLGDNAGIHGAAMLIRHKLGGSDVI